MDVALHLIDWPETANGRQHVDDAHVQRLARQIETIGLLHPITLEPSGERYNGIAGHHRFLAFRTLNRETIPAKLIDGADTNTTAVRFLENVTRRDLTPIEEATQLAALVEHDNAGVDQVAADTGRSTDWILARLELLTFPGRLQDHLHAKTISIATARILARIPNPEERDRYIEAAANHGCSARTAALWLQNATGAQPGQTKSSDFSAGKEAKATTMTTTVVCYGCDEPTALENTRPYRICHTCALTINQAKEQPPPPPPETEGPPPRATTAPETLDTPPIHP